MSGSDVKRLRLMLKNGVPEDSVRAMAFRLGVDVGCLAFPSLGSPEDQDAERAACALPSCPDDCTWSALVKRSAELIIQPPTAATRLRAVPPSDRERTASLAAAVRPVLVPAVETLVARFLAAKLAGGSSVEQKLYAGFDVPALVSRLLTDRPLALVGAGDKWMMRDGRDGAGGVELVGTDDGDAAGPLGLDCMLSYDELALSSFLAVSCPTLFINAGQRGNLGRRGAEGAAFEREGVYVGLVGARFERPGQMEYATMVLTPDQSLPERGYGPAPAPGTEHRAELLAAHAELYGVPHIPCYEEAAADTTGRFSELRSQATGGSPHYLDTEVYLARMRLAADTLLLEARNQAAAVDSGAYVHAVGLGLGVWRIAEEQAVLSLRAFRGAIEALAPGHKVAAVDFSWWTPAAAAAGVLAHGDCVNGVEVIFSKREPAAALTGKHASMLLVASYAWDGGAYPGNEYWWGQLSASGDPAAACCSLISELQNPLVNPMVAGRSRVVLDGTAPPSPSFPPRDPAAPTAPPAPSCMAAGSVADGGLGLGLDEYGAAVAAVAGGGRQEEEEASAGGGQQASRAAASRNHAASMDGEEGKGDDVSSPAAAPPPPPPRHPNLSASAATAALHQLCEDGPDDGARATTLIRQAGIDLAGRPDEYGHTPLMQAAGFGRLAVVTALVETRLHGSGDDRAHVRGRPTFASAGGIMEGADSLSGAPLEQLEQLGRLGRLDMDAQDASGCTALMFASQKGYLSVVQLLVEGGARLDVRDRCVWVVLLARSLKTS